MAVHVQSSKALIAWPNRRHGWHRPTRCTRRLQSLQDAGVSVNAAAGNEYSAGVWQPVEPTRPRLRPRHVSICVNHVLSSRGGRGLDRERNCLRRVHAAGRDVAYQRARGFGGRCDLSDLPPRRYEYVDEGVGTARGRHGLTAQYQRDWVEQSSGLARHHGFQDKFNNIAPLKPTAAILVYDNRPATRSSYESGRRSPPPSSHKRTDRPCSGPPTIT